MRFVNASLCSRLTTSAAYDEQRSSSSSNDDSLSQAINSHRPPKAINSLAYKEITIVEPDTVPDQIHSYNETITIRVNGIKEMIDLMPLQYEPKPISETEEVNKTVKWKLLAAAIAFAVLILSIVISYVFSFEN